MNTFDVLKRLTDANGVSGNEGSAAGVALELLKQYVPDASIDRHGSVVGMIGESGNGNPTVLIDAHIDQIGLIVTHIDPQGFIKAEPCGGIDRRSLEAQSVTIHTATCRLKGTICTKPPHAVKKEDSEKSVKTDDIRIDAGLSEEKARGLISLGDTITLDGGLTQMLGKNVSGSALDDRAGVCAVLFALDLLRNSKVGVNIAVSFSVQEELGCRGASVTAYNIEPDYAIVVDVSYGKSPGVDEKTSTGELGKGAMLGYAPSLNRDMFEGLKKTAAEWEIPYQLEIMGDTSGTNADSIGIVKGGVRTALVSIPLRYMHTPVEMVSLADIESTGHLIAAYIEQIKV